MSHKKYEQPRKGGLGFLPRKRTRNHRGRIRSFPKDDPSKAPHFTAFCGFKAGMTHITRELIRPASRLHKKEIVEAVTIIETPPMKVVGLVGYIETPRGLRALTTVWSSTLDDHFKRRMYKNWYSSKKKAFSKYIQNFSNDTLQKQLRRLKTYCTVIRAICQSQPHLVANRANKKSHVLEVQINGGTIEQKVDYAAGFFEKVINVSDVLAQDAVIDVIGVTKGHGFCGTIKRWGTKLLPKKTHRGYRKVGCIGAWHPANVQYTIARAGQHGYHHRTERGKKIYRIGKAANSDTPVTNNASTESDLTQKNITPMGGFPRYGVVRHDYIMIKGCCVGVKKRALVLRLPIHDRTDRLAKEQIELKFIDTSSKLGHGRFQTTEEKAKFYGRDTAQQE